MGTTLTGTTPQDTYDSLIKVTDNGPISGTAKFLSDGLGNDSVLALSTAAVGVGTASPSTYGANLAVLGSGNGIISVGQATSFATLQSNGQDFYINAKGTGNLILRNGSGDTERMRITSDGNVGIGTSAPTRKLTVVTAAGVAGEFKNQETAASGSAAYGLIVQSEGSAASSYCAVFRDLAETQTYMVIKTETGQDGHVGINTFNPAVHLDVVGNIRTSSGILFGTDTAAANALDDYEEGTFTPTIAFGGASVAMTFGRNGGTYTKIGRQVTICADIILSNKGTSTGSATLRGLPFTINGSTEFLAVPSFRFALMSFSGLVQGFGQVANTFINMENVLTGAGAIPLTHADFTNDTQLMCTFTYFV